MHTVVRHYEGIDSTRLEELIASIREEFIPRLSEIEGLHSYYAIDAGNDAIATIGIFETAAAAEESTRLAATFIREQGLDEAIPNPPQVISGDVVVQHAGIAMR